MRLRALGISAVLCALAAAHCGGETVPLGGAGSQTGIMDTSDAGTTTVPGDLPVFEEPGFPTLKSANKVDILLAVDNSAGMKVKSEYLARSLSSFLQHVSAVTPDIHLGVITSSLGNAGGNVCDTNNPAANTRAHLQRVDEKGAVVVTGGVLELGESARVPAFVADAERLVRGVGEDGCGLEAQLESVYRFLVQPDPYDQVRLDPFKQADLGEGIDVDVLRDRKAFLRPDSLVVVLMITDEDDSTPDPLSVGGFGYAFANRDFPGSNVRRGTTAQGTTAPRGTSVCATDPASADCNSCGFQATCDAQKAECQRLKQDPNCRMSGDPSSPNAVGSDGFYGPTDDDLNVRFFHMKERFGVDPQFPVDRYVAGFGASGAGDRTDEHATKTSASGQRVIDDYTYRKRCTNPLFATQLPSQVGDELCRLPRGPRSPELVVFGVLAGAPPSLVDVASVDWTKVLGKNPEAYDYSGIDPHMIQSTEPRANLIAGGDPNSPRGVNGTDPITGREWNTMKKDLQYACTFQLDTPISCGGNAACDCADDPAHAGTPANNAPLCKSDGSAVQTLGKAYPSTRELLVAKKLGTRAMVGSVCPTGGATSYADFMTRFEGVVLPRLHN